MFENTVFNNPLMSYDTMLAFYVRKVNNSVFWRVQTVCM
jgi:hypothetical protein